MAEDEVSGPYVVVVGSPSDGFDFSGPFDCSEDALQYAERERNHAWWVAPLQEPEGDRPADDDKDLVAKAQKTIEGLVGWNCPSIHLKDIAAVIRAFKWARRSSVERQAILKIQKLMSGTEWSADTLDAIASVMDEAGYKLQDLQE